MKSRETPSSRAAGKEHCHRVALSVESAQEAEKQLATSFADLHLFVHDDSPPPVGSLVEVELRLPLGKPLCRVKGRVVHARPALTPGERTAGMGLHLLELDAIAQQIARSAQRPPAAAAAPRTLRRVETVAPPERAPLISVDGPIVGIDLGTINSCVAVVKAGRPYVITSPQGYQILPSIVFLAQDGSVLVGHRAVEKMILNPGRAVYGSKRFLGRPFTSKEVRNLGHFFNYELVGAPNGRVAARIGEHTIALEEVSGHILRALKEMAQEELRCPVKRAVVTVPAYFGETQRDAVREAGRHAGLYIERILNEPTAAAVAYGYGREGLGTLLIYDLGGGTFDVALLRIDGERVEVIATDGDPFLGGTDFDDRLTEYVLMRFERQHGASLNVRRDVVAVQRIRFAVELAKRQLSEATTTEVFLPYIAKTDKGFVDLRMKLDRQTLETLTQDLVERTFMLMQGVLDSAGITAAQLDDVLLVGGQTRSPHVRRLLAERFGRSPSASVHPDEAVAIGAAIIAEALQRKRPLNLIDVLPASLRFGKSDGTTSLILPRGARLPARHDFALAPESSAGAEAGYRVALYRGEAERAQDNTLVGVVRLPANEAVALAGRKATATVEVSAEGTLAVSIHNHVTGECQQVELSLVSSLSTVCSPQSTAFIPRASPVDS